MRNPAARCTGSAMRQRYGTPDLYYCHVLLILIIYQKSLDRSKKPFHYACNPGQLFDASIGACNEESLVDDYCNINKPKAPETAPVVLELPDDSVKFQCPGDGAYAHQESGCEKYFVCNGERVSWVNSTGQK